MRSISGSMGCRFSSDSRTSNFTKPFLSLRLMRTDGSHKTCLVMVVPLPVCPAGRFRLSMIESFCS